MGTIRVWWGRLSSVAQGVRSESGQDLIEYAMLTGLIVLVTVVSVNTLGDSIDTVLWAPLEPIVSQF